MKLAPLGTLLALAADYMLIQNYGMAHLPGWELGNTHGPVEILLFYDPLCPDSRDAHHILKRMLPHPSPVPGKTYGDLVSLKMNSFVLPFHLHAWQVSQVFSLLSDNCKADASKCHQIDAY